MDRAPFYSLEGPLATLPQKGQVRAAHLQRFPEFINALGRDPVRVLERHDLQLGDICDSDHHIDSEAFLDLIEYCSTHFEKPLFGLEFGSLQGPDVFGPVMAVCKAAPTFGEAIRSFVKYHPAINGPGTVLELEEGQKTTELRFHGGGYFAHGRKSEYLQAQHREVLLIIRLMRQIGGSKFQGNYVTITGTSRQHDRGAIEHTLGCPLRDQAPISSVGFSTHLLNQPVPFSSRHLYALLVGYLDRITTAQRTTIRERVEDYVRESLILGNCSISRCAKKLGVSPRTLQAHLMERGDRFFEIVEQQRIELAKVSLARADLSLSEIAILLGYADQSSFGRAFKRWTRMTPHDYRNAKELHIAEQ